MIELAPPWRRLFPIYFGVSLFPQHSLIISKVPPVRVHMHVSENAVESVELFSAAHFTCSWNHFKPSEEWIDWLKAYAEHQVLPLPSQLNLSSLPFFTTTVLKALAQIPFGTTQTYSGIAQLIGSPRAARAVGGACGRNPYPLFIPCHRVLAKQGEGGFSQEKCIKSFLNSFEQASI